MSDQKRTKLKELTEWDFPDRITVPDGYHFTDAPDLTRGNFTLLIERHNELIRVVNEILEESES